MLHKRTAATRANLKVSFWVLQTRSLLGSLCKNIHLLTKKHYLEKFMTKRAHDYIWYISKNVIK